MKEPIITIKINGVDKTSDLMPYVRSIDLETSFTVDMNPAKLNITFDSNLYYTFNYTDTIQITIKWNDIAEIYVSEKYYVDMLTDSTEPGDQSFQISAIQHYNNFTSDGYSWQDSSTGQTTYANVMTQILSLLGISDFIYPTLPSVFMGRKSQDTDDFWEYSFDSPIEALSELNRLFGCVAVVYENNKLRVYKIEDLANLNLSFSQDVKNVVTSIGFNPSVDAVGQSYRTWYLNFGSITSVTWNPPNVIANSKTIETNSDDGSKWQNYSTSLAVSKGSFYTAKFDITNTSIEMMGNAAFKAGIKFNLGTAFERFAGDYFAHKVIHSIRPGEWKTQIDAFPIQYNLNSAYNSGMLFDATPQDRPVTLPPSNPGTAPTNNLIITKYLDRGVYVSNARFTDLTVSMMFNFITVELPRVYGTTPLSSYTPAQITNFITDVKTIADANLIRWDHAMALMWLVTYGFTTKNTAQLPNIFFLGYSPYSYDNLLPGIDTEFKGCSAYVELLVRMSANRAFVGTPYHYYVTNWTRGFFRDIYQCKAINYSIEDQWTIDFLKRLYIYSGLATSNVTVQS